MFCKNCGTELAEGQRFCGNCGAAQEPAAQFNPQPNPNPQPAPAVGGSNQDTLDLVLKILAGIGAVFFAIRAIVSLVGIFTGLVGAFQLMRYIGVVVGLFSLVAGPVVSVLLTVINAAICVALLCFVLRKNDEHNEHLFLGLCAGGALLIVAQILRALLLGVTSLISPYYGVAAGGVILGIVGSIFCGVIPVGVVFLLLYLMGKTPLKGKNGDEIKAMANGVVPAVTAVLGIKSKKANTQADDQAAFQSESQSAPEPQPEPQPQPNAYVPPNPDRRVPLKTDRGLVAYILLSIITCGIYGYYFLYSMARDVNIACQGDGKKTGGLLAFILLSYITCGFYALYWYYSLGNRLAANAPRYGMNFQENGTTVLLWYLVGALLCGIGPYVAMHFLIKNTNAICSAYNQANGLYN